MEKVKIIFLDVDGVLNIMSSSYNSFKLTSTALEPHLVRRLEFIIERVSRSTSLKIVISSSWHEDNLIENLKKYNFKYVNDIVGRTPRNNFNLRGDQIKDWLDNHQDEYSIDNYIVLEDEISDVCGDKCKTISKFNVVEVDMNEGLLHKNCIEAIHKLMNFDMTLNGQYFKNTKEGLDYFVKLGFEPSVNSPENEQWKSFRVNMNDMLLHMLKD